MAASWLASSFREVYLSIQSAYCVSKLNRLDVDSWRCHTSPLLLCYLTVLQVWWIEVLVNHYTLIEILKPLSLSEMLTFYHTAGMFWFTSIWGFLLIFISNICPNIKKNNLSNRITCASLIVCRKTKICWMADCQNVLIENNLQITYCWKGFMNVNTFSYNGIELDCL